MSSSSRTSSGVQAAAESSWSTRRRVGSPSLTASSARPSPTKRASRARTTCGGWSNLPSRSKVKWRRSI
eukprot:6374495-Lingulodinium_polyedra.AAC.1